MLVLHSHYQPPDAAGDPGGVLFWVETSDVARPAGRRGRVASKPQPHPFCGGPEGARLALDALRLSAAGGRPGQATLLLPAQRDGPHPSPQLLHNWSLADKDPPALAAWKIEGLWLEASQAFAVLLNLHAAEEMPAGVAAAADARYWRLVTSLTLEALAQQKVAPTLAQGDGKRGGYQARWLPVLDGPQDAPRLARLRAAMPPICRSGRRMDDPELSPAGLLDSFIRIMADAQARQWGSNGSPGALRTRDPAASRWIRALFDNNAAVEASPAQLAALERSMRIWMRNLHVAGTGDFRVTFRLAPPPPAAPAPEASATAAPGDQPGAAPAWQVGFLLQARDDPSLLVPAAEIWQTRGEVLQRVGRQFDRPQERLLAALGYATRLFPPIGRSLRGAHPEDLALSTDEAFNFMREAAPLLEQSGFGVLVPRWWNQRGARPGLKLKLKSKGGQAAAASGKLSFEQLVNFQWSLSVGDTALTEEEFQALVALKSPLVQVRGQWVQLDPDQIEAALKFWQSRQAQGEIGLLEALQIGLGAEETVAGLPVEDVAYEGWLEEWLQRLTGREKLAELPQPASLRGQLRPYQRYGFSWLEFLRRWGLGTCLADDMGLGKSIQALALLLHDKERGAAAGPVLLICPTSVVGNWMREASRFAPDLSTWVHRGLDRLHGEEFGAEAARHDLVLTSYALARRDAETLQAVEWRGVVLDEAQNIKNPGAKQTQEIRKLAGWFRIALTGTPVENRLSELWSIMHFLNPGYLGSQDRFRKTFALPVERYGDEDTARRLKGLVSPFILRRVKTDPRVIQDLPEKLEMKVYCNLTEEQASLYEAVVAESLTAVEEAEGIDRRGQVLAMLMKLKQVCDHPALFLHQAGAGDLTGRSGKLDRLAEMLEEAVAAGDRSLVFTQFAEMGQILHGYLQNALGVPALFLYGGTPAPQRDQMIARFQGQDGPPIFVLSLKAGGVGLNLMAANHVFHFDRWWNPAVEDQATDRAFRIGQTRNVQVHKYISSGTMEEMIDDLIESKRSLAQAIIGGGENWLTELSTDDLRKLVTLRRERT